MWYEHLQLPVSEDNERAALDELLTATEASLASLSGTVQTDLTTLAEAEPTDREYLFAAVRYAERRALQGLARRIDARTAELGRLEYYQTRRLNALGLQPIETEEELEALRAAGRSYTSNEFDW